MTLQEIYDTTGSRFKMKLLAGSAGMEKEVSRLYYFEDLSISDWTRDGELLITTAMMTSRDPDWILKFVKSVQSFHPCGIMVNIGGYLEHVPQRVIDYCEQIGLPLFSFPWEVVLQDIMTEITNLIYVTEQRENNLAQAFRNVIFNREDESGYQTCFAKNGIDQYDRFIAVLCSLPGDESKKRHFLRTVRSISEKNTLLRLDEEELVIFYGMGEGELNEALAGVRREWMRHNPEKEVRISIGSEVKHYSQLESSWRKARICRQIGEKQGTPLTAFCDLGILGVLAGGEREVLQRFCEDRLHALHEYDRNNASDYARTLETYLFSRCNAGAAAEKLYIHRNTVNYRLRKISEITGEDLSDIETLLNYRIAFLGELVL